MVCAKKATAVDGQVSEPVDTGARKAEGKPYSACM
jgi:hypothetical protein